MAMPINLPFEFKFKDGYELRLILDVAKVFGGTHAISVSDTASSTHSRINDPLAGRLRDNLLRAFRNETNANTDPQKASPRPAESIEVAQIGRAHV